MIEFEYDTGKSLANRDKHGIDFDEAQQLWSDPAAVEIEINSEIEPRFVLIAMQGNKYWSAVFTYRRSRIRLISVRRSRKREVDIYESERLRQEI